MTKIKNERKNVAILLNSSAMSNLYEDGAAKNRYKELKFFLNKKIKDMESKKNNYSQLSQYEISLNEAKQYYYEKYGSDLFELSDFVTTMESFKKVLE